MSSNGGGGGSGGAPARWAGSTTAGSATTVTLARSPATAPRECASRRCVAKPQRRSGREPSAAHQSISGGRVRCSGGRVRCSGGRVRCSGGRVGGSVRRVRCSCGSASARSERSRSMAAMEVPSPAPRFVEVPSPAPRFVARSEADADAALTSALSGGRACVLGQSGVKRRGSSGSAALSSAADCSSVVPQSKVSVAFANAPNRAASTCSVRRSGSVRRSDSVRRSGSVRRSCSVPDVVAASTPHRCTGHALSTALRSAGDPRRLEIISRERPDRCRCSRSKCHSV
jgi:hypothetical protein